MIVSFGATPDIFSEFNFYEAIFWIVLGLVVLLAIRWAPVQLKKWLWFSGVNVFLFGITDVVEMYTGGFLHTAHWLLYWKVLHVIGLLVSVWWYVKIRLKSEVSFYTIRRTDKPS